MSAPDSPALAGMSIGAVLDLLRPDFPDVTISKIRFLEAEGLVTPRRASSGYRRFTAYDCARLRFILTAQRDHYLPLKVIRAQLDAQPDGELPPFGSPYVLPRLVPVAGDSAGGVGSDTASVSLTGIRLSREDLLERSEVADELLTALLGDVGVPAGWYRVTALQPGAGSRWSAGRVVGSAARRRVDLLFRRVTRRHLHR